MFQKRVRFGVKIEGDVRKKVRIFQKNMRVFQIFKNQLKNEV